MRKSLQFELRKHRGRQLCPDFIADIAKRLEVAESNIALVDLETSDRFLEEARNIAKAKHDELEPYFKQLWHVEEIAEVVRAIEELRIETADKPMLLYRRLSEYCGAVRVSLRQILTHTFSLVELDGEEVLAYTEDQKSGIRFGYYEDWSERGSQNIYELVLWGKEWLND